MPAILAACGNSLADDGWHFYRGPNYDGHAANSTLAESWPPDGPPVLWVREAGSGYSSIVAWQGRIATQWQTLAGQYVVCLDADTGETVWQYRYDWPYLPGSVYPGPRSTPTYWNGRLFFAAPDGVVGCLDAESGKLLWSNNLKQRFDGKGTDFGYSCSPVVVDGKVVLPVGGLDASIVALDAATGDVVWRAGDDPASYASVLPITFQGRTLLIGYLQNALVCHDMRTGKRLWRRPLSQGYDEHSSWPIYREPYLWMANAFRGGSELLEIVADNPLTARPAWNSPLMSNDILSSVLVDNALFGFDVRDAQAKSHRPTRGSFRCINFMDGVQNWATNVKRPRRSSSTTTDNRGKRIGHSSVLVADGKLVLLNDTGELILARASSVKYIELARALILGGEICWTQPILYRNRVYARNQSRIVCVYVGKTDELDQQLLAQSIPASEMRQEAYRDLASVLLGIEPEYAFDIPSMEWLVEWFLWAWPGILGVSWFVSHVFRWLSRYHLSQDTTRRVFWCLAFILGAIGTTVLSHWQADFVFTWPVCIFIAFQATVFQLRSNTATPEQRPNIWRARLVAFFFLATCLTYFLLCRRLSLVFEWVFLCGFAAALPFCLAAALWFRKKWWYVSWEALLTSIAFAAFYWSSVGILAWKGT